MTATVQRASRAFLERIPNLLYIGGVWAAGQRMRTMPVTDPCTGAAVTAVADAEVEDGVRAAESAAAAQAAWGATSPRSRALLLHRGYEALMDAQDVIASVICTEVGKPMVQARAEVAYAADFLRWFAEEAVRVDGTFTVHPEIPGRRTVVSRRPIGPALLITPWNFPLAMCTRKLAPALAAGCTSVLKPAPQTPLSALLLAQIFDEAGLPPGVLNVVSTSQAGEVVTSILGTGLIRKLSFTGSTAVGRHLLRQCADTVVNPSMELGGNAAFIVLDDADLDLAVEGAVAAKMRNMGQTCTSANRFFVHRRIAEEFAAKLVRRLDAMHINLAEPGSGDVGPLIDAAAVAKVEGLVDDAVERGAVVLTGGRRLAGPGHFFAPTVLADVDGESRLCGTEIFGPVVALLTFDEDHEAVARANATEYGLAGYIFSQDIGRALRLGERLEVGTVGINTGAISDPTAPFGGVKQSGIGTEGGAHGIDEFLQMHTTALQLHEARVT